MSRVPYQIDVDRFICTELEQIRTMIKTLDFSPLAATVERIQHHASAMEEALYRYEGIKYKLKKGVDDNNLSDKEFRQKAVEVMKDLKPLAY